MATQQKCSDESDAVHATHMQITSMLKCSCIDDCVQRSLVTGHALHCMANS